MVQCYDYLRRRRPGPRPIWYATAAILLIVTSDSPAGEWDFSADVAAEVRMFPQPPAFEGQQDATVSPSIAIEPEVVYEWNENRDRLTLLPFARYDAYDDNRTHADLRQASWLHVGSAWDLVIGIDKVFWGVTESRHLVDIVNQDDQVEDIDAEDKLGQPMINLNLYTEWGGLEFFVLPWFRERTFPADDARLRGPLPIAGDSPDYESTDRRSHVDYALRWDQVIGPWDVGIAHFDGTSREPRLVPSSAGGRQVLVPYYDQIAQTSMDLQFTQGAWLWKLEAITRTGYGERFAAAVAGFEHTWFGIRGSNADLGLLAEYLYDGRDNDTAPPTALEDDVFIGTRLALNDIQDTAVLAGAIVDRESLGSILFVEASRRIGSRWTLEFETRLFVDIADDDFLAGYRNDSFATVRLSRFF